MGQIFRIRGWGMYDANVRNGSKADSWAKNWRREQRLAELRRTRRANGQIRGTLDPERA